MLEVRDVSLTFHKHTPNEKRVLNHLSLTVEKGDFISILGTNGAGKSTLLNVISGSIPNDTGTIILDGKDITALPEYKRAKEIGHVFQDPLKGTAPHMTIEENLGLAYSRGKRSTFSRAIRKTDRTLFIEKLKQLGLGLEDRLQTPAGLLSGGQRQALTLLMAIIETPKLLLLDEHTAALDPKIAKKIMEITDDIIKEYHITTLMITHNIKQALEYGNKTILMQDGMISKIFEYDERNNLNPEDILKMYEEY